MLANYYTLRIIAHDLDRQLAGSKIGEIFCQSKNELTLVFDAKGTTPALIVSCEPSENFIFCRSDVHRAKKNSVDVFRAAWQENINGIEIHPADRELTIHCGLNRRILIQLFGSKANVLLVDDRNIVADSFLKSKELVGTKHEPRPAEASRSLLTLEEFSTQLRSIGSVVVPAALRKQIPLFGSILVREACFRARVGEQRLVAELSDGDIQEVFQACVSVLKQLEHPSPRIYFRESTPIVFSLVQLEHVQADSEELIDSLHDAMRMFVGRARRRKSLLHEKEELLRFFDGNIGGAERTLAKMAKETESMERMIGYEACGKLLMANLHLIEKGMKEVRVEDVFRSSREWISIRLEPHLSPAKNAERYFEKSKKARAAIEEQTAQRREVEERWESLRSMRDELGPVQTLERLSDYLNIYRPKLLEMGYRFPSVKGESQKADIPFRIFTVAGGFQVWAGKSSENNDLLTMKYAKPNDLWFHARGSSGSHVVLRVGTGKGEPARQAIEQAAAIAAYYSKMKTSALVPVAMTERKYVRKPKGASAGTVMIEREKILFVRPTLPAR